MASNDFHEDLSVHVFTVSAGMVGVCLTVIGIIRVVITFSRVDTVADDLLAFDALIFLVACLTAYWSLRTRQRQRAPRLERVADALFVAAMLLMTGTCAFITYAITAPMK